MERWRQIVQRALRNGTDISQLVQHFAERAFENKTVSLDSQGAKRRALTQMRQTLSREITRAQKVLEAHTDSKKPALLRPFQGITLTFLPPQRSAKPVKKTAGHITPLSMDGDTQASKSAPLPQKIATAPELITYIATLTAQGVAIDEEMAQIDEVLNRGMHNRESTVAELSATSKELWRIAQEEVLAAEVAAAKAPAPGAEAAQTALPTPMSEEKTAALPTPEPAAPAAASKPSQPSAGQSLLQNVQALFKKKS